MHRDPSQISSAEEYQSSYQSKFDKSKPGGYPQNGWVLGFCLNLSKTNRLNILNKLLLKVSKQNSLFNPMHQFLNRKLQQNKKEELNGGSTSLTQNKNESKNCQFLQKENKDEMLADGRISKTEINFIPENEISYVSPKDQNIDDSIIQKLIQNIWRQKKQNGQNIQKEFQQEILINHQIQQNGQKQNQQLDLNEEREEQNNLNLCQIQSSLCRLQNQSFITNYLQSLLRSFSLQVSKISSYSNSSQSISCFQQFYLRRQQFKQDNSNILSGLYQISLQFQDYSIYIQSKQKLYQSFIMFELLMNTSVNYARQLIFKSSIINSFSLDIDRYDSQLDGYELNSDISKITNNQNIEDMMINMDIALINDQISCIQTIKNSKLQAFLQNDQISYLISTSLLSSLESINYYQNQNNSLLLSKNKALLEEKDEKDLHSQICLSGEIIQNNQLKEQDIDKIVQKLMDQIKLNEINQFKRAYVDLLSKLMPEYAQQFSSLLTRHQAQKY